MRQISNRLGAAVLGVLACSPLVFMQPAAAAETTDALTQDRIVKILRSTNKAQTNQYVPKVYELQHANPFSIRAYIQRAMEVEEGAMYTFLNPDGGGLLLVVCPEYQIPSLDRLVATLDRPGQTTLNKWKRIYQPTKHRSVIDPGFLATLFQYGGPDAGLQFLADTEVNAFRVVGAPSSVEGIMAGMEYVDLPTPQVRLEVTVYEINLQNDNSIGLDYISWKNGPGRNLFAVGAFAEREGVTELSGHSDFIAGDTGRGAYGLPSNRIKAYGTNYAYNLNVSAEFFDYLAAKGKARVVNSASVAAMSDTAFIIDARDRVFYTEVRSSDGSTAIRPPETPLDPAGSSDTYPDNRTVVSRNAEVGVLVEGHVIIGNNNVVTVELTNSVSNLAGYDGTGVPLVTSQEFRTTITVPQDKETVIGGLVRERQVESTSKVPVLGSLPVVGYLFGGGKTLSQKTMVAVVITPRGVEDFSGMTPADTSVADRAQGTEALSVPSPGAGFDQYGLDR